MSDQNEAAMGRRWVEGLKGRMRTSLKAHRTKNRRRRARKLLGHSDDDIIEFNSVVKQK